MIKTKILGLKIKNKMKTSGFEIKIKIFTCQAQDQHQDSKLCDHTATSTTGISLLVKTSKFKDCCLTQK